MGLTLAEVYKCRLNEDGLEMIDVFVKMVKWIEELTTIDGIVTAREN